MDERQKNHLRTGILFVAPGQIMDPGIMNLRRRPSYLSWLRADVGLLEAEPAAVEQPSWSFQRLLEQIGEFFYRRRPVSM